MTDKKEIEVITLGTGRLWPHYKGKKALSANTLTKILREIEYGEIPAHILLQAAQRGKSFHEIVQEFIQTGRHPLFVSLKEVSSLGKLEQKVHETINFLKEKKSLELNNFLGKEKLHYAFYKGELLATYVDLEFSDYVIELKSNSIKVKGIDTTNSSWELLSSSLSPVGLLIFEVQLIIQSLCTGKDIYLLWSTGQGVIFSKFKLNDYSLKILDMLIDLVKNEETYTLPAKKAIIQGIVDQHYLPKK
ncbi:MAG: hypothetical protein I3273_00515 [Candidatus Moeniiplasma glomeromycotorum]|nr:hypothetical protein [Candidatus Moeniiplasma glomeromycotorum]MCE8167392.1 hypothetical protein [Candidatus Moeniiplasma glomeromycotorum]MCE8168595.1 hypothetical protein [Candidatus Moeniiplasma glomeromycotorum]